MTTATRKQTAATTSVPRSDEYNLAALAIIFGIKASDVRKLIDEGVWRGRPVAHNTRDRVMSHNAVMRLARGNFGNFSYALAQIEGLEPCELSMPLRQP